MPSSSTGPYKSRLFNLINRQSILWGDRVEKTVRQLKVAAEWGVQILLYPIYLIVQASRLVGLQLEQKLEHLQAQLPPSETELDSEAVNSDKPITEILQAIESWLPAVLPEANSPSLHSQIRGLASLLETHSIVLVTKDSQILDIFDRQQQDKLQQQIAWEVANYSRERRLAKLAAYQSARQLPLISANNPNILLPVRLFWRVMEWVQTSSVATSVNIFGEANLSFSASNSYLPSLPTISLHFPETGIFTNLDNTVAEIEATEVFSEAANLPENEIEAENLLQIQALIQAAIDYFFSKKGWQFSDRDNPTVAIESTQPEEVIYLPESEEWLSKEDLFIEPEPQLVLAAKPSANLEKPVDRLTQAQNEQIENINFIDRSLSKNEPDSFRIQALIFAAIDYFFGKKEQTDKKNIHSPKQKPTHNLDSIDVAVLLEDNLSNAKERAEAIELDPWLSEAEKGQETTTKSRENSIEQSSEPHQLPSSANTSILKKIVENNKRNPRKKQRNEEKQDKVLKQITNNKQPITTLTPNPSSSERGEINNQQQSSLQYKPPAPTNLAKQKNSSTKIVNSPNKTTTVTFAEPEATQLETKQDWLETEAKSIGYVKHPLEIILAWLDRMMLWLEEVAVKIWHWLKKTLKNK